MNHMTATQMLLYVAGIAIVLFILGMVGSKHSNKNQKNPFHSKEYFEVPDVSSAEDVSSGASSLYGWGYDPIKKQPSHSRRHKCPHCENIFIDRIDITSPATENVCRNCDITKNKDIDKYVLKSSIPPCPNMDDYALKNQLPPAGFNPDEWIRKSEIPPCPPQPNMNDYIRKDEIPPCNSANDCPKCPECPICPKCPPCESRIVEKIVSGKKSNYDSMSQYFPTIPKYLPQNIDNYPQASGIWRPKLSDTNSGFISPDIPLAGNLRMTRRSDELRAVQR